MPRTAQRGGSETMTKYPAGLMLHCRWLCREGCVSLRWVTSNCVRQKVERLQDEAANVHEYVTSRMGI